jgi:transcription elongation factor Elf1
VTCPTCGHATLKIGVADAHDFVPTFWCPRCGTATIGNPADPGVYAPQLVARCRAFGDSLGCAYGSEWVAVAECVRKPEESP